MRKERSSQGAPHQKFSADSTMAAGTISLSVVTGAMSGLVGVFDIKKRVTVGRLRGNKFQIKADTVSSKHAIIAYVDGGWFITDCGSSNGTLVNGISLVSGVPAELKDGDMLLVGAGSDNNVKVTIEMPERIDAPVQRDSHPKDYAPSALTLEQWIAQEVERLCAFSDASAQAALKTLAESAEQAKRDVCTNADFY